MLYIAIPNQYGYVLLISTLIAFEILLIGFFLPGGARKKAFPLEFMRLHFQKEHSQSFNKDIEEGGYPDMGSGKYSQKLSYKDWYQFNSAQRAHYNFLEWIASTILFILVSGVYFAIPSAVLGLVVFIARIIYSVGYVKGGPKGRSIGALLNDLGMLGLFVLSVISSIYWITGKAI